MNVSLVHSAAAREVTELALQVPEGCTARMALTLAGWSPLVSGVEDQSLTLGIWGRRITQDQLLRDGDRLEVYRSLRVDPKVARRERFVGQGARGTGLFARRKPGSKAGY
jgi:putative ubiquitin-RnfH superfamily antitoxin RatB of RatAB toxin-antitoxin module